LKLGAGQSTASGMRDAEGAARTSSARQLPAAAEFARPAAPLHYADCRHKPIVFNTQNTAAAPCGRGLFTSRVLSPLAQLGVVAAMAERAPGSPAGEGDEAALVGWLNEVDELSYWPDFPAALEQQAHCDDPVIALPAVHYLPEQRQAGTGAPNPVPAAVPGGPHPQQRQPHPALPAGQAHALDAYQSYQVRARAAAAPVGLIPFRDHGAMCLQTTSSPRPRPTRRPLTASSWRCRPSRRASTLACSARRARSRTARCSARRRRLAWPAASQVRLARAPFLQLPPGARRRVPLLGARRPGRVV
jgi:hypothetical protein